ncbi:hypothetical protein N7453_005614 [Penicillium expansum]|nr:hypothetical protein N7453_005614 [Penicillium expansum]
MDQNIEKQLWPSWLWRQDEFAARRQQLRAELLDASIEVRVERQLAEEFPSAARRGRGCGGACGGRSQWGGRDAFHEAPMDLNHGRVEPEPESVMTGALNRRLRRPTRRLLGWLSQPPLGRWGMRCGVRRRIPTPLSPSPKRTTSRP